MIQFTRLRINGFKSFVDRTELDVGPGLSGVVGPNGCGKSNLVEALRWVMGESSAKRMRGGGMEDVIFNGTSKRSPRNIAEVALLLDNSTRTAPAAYNNSDEIEIVRRIERDHGSNYKINGKNVRARDVQMLFADTVTGANSPALVSQGRVTQIINAKPLDRRLILEESAGISGLYARRHEAEIRLKAADANLVRIEDIVGSMESRLSGLKRQARQASRYRNINTQIRQFEILLAFMEWQTLDERLKETKRAFDQAESLVAERLATVTQLTKTQTTQAEDLPALRKKEAEAAAKLQTRKIALQRLEDESNRIEHTIQEAQSQLEQASTDYNHETLSLQENTQRLELLGEEQKKIQAEQDREDVHFQEKDSARDLLEKKVQDLEARYTALMQGVAEAKARQDSLRQALQTNENRMGIVSIRRDKAREELAVLHENSKAGQDPQQLDAEIEALQGTVKELQNALDHSENEISKTDEAVNAAREHLKELEFKKSEFNTEINLLESFLKDESQEKFTPVLADISLDKGFEKALSRALGDSLMASLDRQASASWIEINRSLENLPPLPQGAAPLLPHVKAPKALISALSQIGVVEREDDAQSLIQALAPGQSLVSKDGSYWRWDGFHVKATAKDPHSQRLEQQGQLKDLIGKRPQIEKRVADSLASLEKTLQRQEQARTERQKTQMDLKTAQNALVERKNTWMALKEAQTRLESETMRLEQSVQIAEDDIKELSAAIADNTKKLAAAEQDSQQGKVQQLEKLKESLSEARESHSAALRAYDLFVQQQNTRKARLHAIADERVNLQNRSIRAREHLKGLTERQETLSEKLKTLQNQPQDFKVGQEKLLDEISALETERTQEAEKLAVCEHDVGETGRALREAEHVMGEAREARAHAQATFTALQEQREALNVTILEKFEMKPQDLPQHSAIDMDKDFGDLESLRQKKEHLIRDRDAIGPVNLRAEDESQTLEAELTALLHERNDLSQAIEELRGGIQKINKEARERLLAAFDHVNAHFQSLFVRLFGGGQAHLALVDSPDLKDPLGAGLEIFAQPPGKSLQSLSLLSGGEQTLASIALIFAMFLTNPSPICVLDEIDAPLDDSNVDRVCDLLEEIAERGETRFLVITHHRLTMARMNRLYGVTMAERGISQLVSVDLQQSFNFLEAA